MGPSKLPKHFRHVAGRPRFWHRRAVGGTWEVSGSQFLQFLKRQGMRPHHRLLDVGCGSLRGGVRFIEYLEPGNYYGLEPSMPLLGAGISIELPLAGIGPDKRPRFLINDDFDLSELPPNVRFDYAFANSVFTHLPPDRIEQSTRTVLERLTPQGKFFATFYMAKKRDLEGPPRPWIGNARYPAKEIKSMVEAAGGQAKFIGDWEHARKEQRMWCITKAE